MTQNDKEEIVEILNLYAFALDARQWNLFDRVFAPDVVAEFGPAGTAWTDLEEFTRGFAAFHATLDSHQHTMMGQLVHVDGDTARAFSYGNWLLIREAAVGGSTWSGTGWYDDELARTDKGWRITRRVCKAAGVERQPAGSRAERHAESGYEAQQTPRIRGVGRAGLLAGLQLSASARREDDR